MREILKAGKSGNEKGKVADLKFGYYTSGPRPAWESNLAGAPMRRSALLEAQGTMMRDCSR
jgi:hypothetical protein